jgi:hypothetical protein
MDASGDGRIWRYMDLARYTLLLSRGVFFARADRFDDRWEGSWGGVDLRQFRKRYVELEREPLEQAWNDTEKERLTALRRVGVSCWHKADHESAALWELYLPRGLGVAVCSSISRVQRSLALSNRSITTIAVQYSDYSALELGLEAANLLAHKRPEFAHEREVRFLLTFRDDELDRMASFAEAEEELSQRVIVPGIPRPVVRTFRATVSVGTHDPTLDSRVAPNGVHVATDIAQLIECVALSPRVAYPIRRAIIELTEARGLPRQLVRESTMDAIPYSNVRIVDD